MGTMKTVILAGGFGTRISEESHLRPKPMIEIGGKPILWHIMKIYSHFGFNEFIICCGYRGDMIKEYFANYYLYRSDVTFDFSNRNKLSIHTNDAEPWKVTLVDTGLNTMTGGRIRRIQKYVKNESFMLTYGDGVGDVDIPALIEQHKKSGRAVTLTATQPGGRFGVLEIDMNTDNVTGFREKARPDNNWVNTGFMVMEPEVFQYLEGDGTVLEADPLENLSRAGKLGVFRHYGYWQCMDTQRDKKSLEDFWDSGRAPWAVWQSDEKLGAGC
jgi:glucose-1-phosphate cytidylyltransferase